MKVEVVPLTSFAHDKIDAHEGKPFFCEKGIADELEKAGLVRVKRPPVQGVQQPPVNIDGATKGPDDGVGRPSSVSPAAPASPTTTSLPFAPGARRGRTTGA